MFYVFDFKPQNNQTMRIFFNGFSLLFNPSLARKLYFSSEKTHDTHWLAAFGYLTKAYYEEKKHFDSK